MKIIFNDRVFEIMKEESSTLRDIEKLLPLHLTMRNNHVEYVAELPAKPVNDGPKVSETIENGIYYYAGWNCLCLNFQASDISPYTITYLGKTEDPAFSQMLKEAGETIEVTVE